MVFKHFGFIYIFLLSFISCVEAREIRSAEEVMRLGDRSFLNERYAEAENFYVQASELHPKDAAPAVHLGELFYAQARFEEARQMFEKAVTLKKNPPTRKFLNAALPKINQSQELLQQIEKATREKNLPELDRLHAIAAERMAEVPSFMALLGPHLDYLSKRYPEDERILQTLAEGYFSSGNPAKAFGYYKKLIKKTRPDMELYKRFGDTAVNVGDYDEARLSYKKALREAVRHRDVPRIREYKKWTHKLPIFTRQIDAKIQAEDYEGAFRELRKCLTRNPTHSWAIVQMGRIYEEIGRLSQAQTLYQQAIRWHEEDPNAHYALGRFYLFKKKKFEKALEEFKLFRALLSDLGNPSDNPNDQKKLQEYARDATRSIASIYLTVLREPKMAVIELENLKKSGNFDAEDYYDLGVAYLQSNKKPSAYQDLKKAIEKDPKSEAAKNAESLIESLREVSREGFEVEADR